MVRIFESVLFSERRELSNTNYQLFNRRTSAQEEVMHLDALDIALLFSNIVHMQNASISKVCQTYEPRFLI